mgnify:CR=1 FL=1
MTTLFPGDIPAEHNQTGSLAPRPQGEDESESRPTLLRSQDNLLPGDIQAGTVRHLNMFYLRQSARPGLHVVVVFVAFNVIFDVVH